jgi:DNA-binding HxlR family transcriptional regulator
MIRLDSIEERLERIEKLLGLIMNRLLMLEEKLRLAGIDSTEIRTAYELLSLTSIPPLVALEASRRFYRVLSMFRDKGIDEITKSIIKVLSTCEKLSISEITRRVRILRGKASRRIISEKLKLLNSLGIIVCEEKPNKYTCILRSCIERI